MRISTSRVETLADGVFAIAMTLLVLNLKIADKLNHDELIISLKELWPQWTAYIVSFMVLAVYWIGHHNQYAWIESTDRIFLWINIFFLMSIAFVPFSTSLLASYPKEKMPVIIYGCNVIFSGIMLYAHWNYAQGKGKLIKIQIDGNLNAVIKRRILMGICFYCISVALCFLSTTLSLVLYAALPFFYMPLSKVDRHLKGQQK